MNFEKFKDITELETYIEETCGWHTREPLYCHICGAPLVDCEGWTEFMTQEDYPDLEFCSERCIMEYLISMGYLEEED